MKSSLLLSSVEIKLSLGSVLTILIRDSSLFVDTALVEFWTLSSSMSVATNSHRGREHPRRGYMQQQPVPLSESVESEESV